MQNKKILIPVVVVGAMLVLIGFVFLGQEDYAIIVNDEKITREEFMQEVDKIMENTDEDRETIKEDLQERMVERMIFSSYLSSVGINVSRQEINDKYQSLVDFNPDVETVEQMKQKWKEEGVNMTMLEKQLKEEVVYEKLFEQYVEEVHIDEEELSAEYKKYVQESENFEWGPISKEEFEDQLKFRKASDRIEEEREAFEKEVGINIIL